MKSKLITLLLCLLAALPALGPVCGSNGPQTHTITRDSSTTHTFNTGVSVNLNALAFPNAANGLIAGDSGVVLRTTNGGESFTVSSINANSLFGIACTRDTAFTMAGAVAVGALGTVMHSTNGGSTWAPASIDTPTTKILRAVSFKDEFNGLIVGDSGKMLRSTNGGLSWTTLASVTTRNLRSVYLVPLTSTAFAAGDSGLVLKSTDGGITWISKTLTGVNLNGIFMIEDTVSSVAVAVGDSGKTFRSLNGGLTWDSLASPTSKKLRGVHLSTRAYGYAVGDSGTVLRYWKGSWVSVTAPTTNNLNAVDPYAISNWDFCVGDDGTVFWELPPLVTAAGWSPGPGISDPLPTADPSCTGACTTACTWTFTLNKGTTEEVRPPVTYVGWRITATEVINPSPPPGPGSGYAITSGWGMSPPSVMYAYSNFTPSASSHDPTRISYCLMDTENAPHFLVSFTISCP